MNVSRRTVLISGASGMIGAALIRTAEAKQIQVLKLIRRGVRAADEISWRPEADSPVEHVASLEGLDAAIHLSGANLSSRRWTQAYKQEIAESRIGSTRALVKVLASLKQPPKTLLCASATGIYGERGDEILTEDSSTGSGFLEDVCRQWEAEADRAKEAGIRVVHLRFSVVLSPGAGALHRMLPLFRLGMGGRLGSGQEWMSWIALTDVVRAIYFALESTEIKGPVNLSTPNPVTNKEFTRALGEALHRPAFLAVPAFALRAAFGEIADAALLASTRALPKRLSEAGFEFVLPEIGHALRAMLQK
jgi:uncharacterized protein (TIGR01777 family)